MYTEGLTASLVSAGPANDSDASVITSESYFKGTLRSI
jgi:hypothetical protein